MKLRFRIVANKPSEANGPDRESREDAAPAAMVDLHAHVLPGFDDGAEDWQQAINMCRQARADGIVCLAATPHFHRGIFPTPKVDAVRSATDELVGLCGKSLIDDFEVVSGSDCHLHAELVANLEGGRIPTLNGSRYLLLELPDDALPQRLNELIFDLRMSGTTPIITHPERNAVLAGRPRVLYDLLQNGAYAQVTATSLTGLFGEAVQRVAQRMVGQGHVQIIASDAHNSTTRPPVLSAGWRAAARIVGSELASRMVVDVPRAVVANEPIHFPEPVDPRPPKRRRKGLLERVLGRWGGD